MASTSSPLSCPRCSAALPPDAHFCPACGTRLAADETLELPADPVHPEPAAAVPPIVAPPTLHHVHRRPLGIHPVPLLGALGILALVLAIVLLAGGPLVGGVILLGLALAFLTLFFAGVRREPDAPTARLTLRAADRYRSLARLAAATVRALARAGLELLRIRSRQHQLRRDLQRQLKPLGQAVHLDDRHQVQVLKQHTTELEQQLAETKREASAAISTARTEIERERATTQSTQALVPAGAEEPDGTQPPQSAAAPSRPTRSASSSPAVTRNGK